MTHLPVPSGVRKRPCNPDSWKQNAAKKARQSGEAYRSPFHGRMVAAKRVGQPCKCTKDCFGVIGLETLKAINTDFWALRDHTLQSAFIQGS